MKEDFKINTKESHLLPGIKPILVCEGSFNDFGIENPYPKEGEPYQIDFGLKNPQKIDLEMSAEQVREKNFLSGGEQTYTISSIDDSDKFSIKFSRCVGLVVAGVDKTTKKNISFVSHQDPFSFLLGEKEKFIKDLGQRLTEMKGKCKEGTIDAVMVGGIYMTDHELDTNQVFEHYKAPIKLIGEEVEKVLGFEPIVVNGPKTTRKNSFDDIYYNNENRRLYFLRKKLNDPRTKGPKDFPPSEIEEQRKDWDRS